MPLLGRRTRNDDSFMLSLFARALRHDIRCRESCHEFVASCAAICRDMCRDMSQYVITLFHLRSKEIDGLRLFYRLKSILPVDSDLAAGFADLHPGTIPQNREYACVRC